MTSTIEPRNDWRKRLYRHFTQSVTIFPSEEADLSTTLGDAISSGIDVQVMGIEGNALIKSGSSEYQAQVTADVSERLPRFSLKLSDGTLVDLSNLRVAVDFDYKKSISPTKSESFGRANEIKDTGDISGVMLTNYESYDLTGKYTFCNHQIAYLTKLQISHELELNILVARFKQAKKKLYTQRHLLLISRVDAVKNNLADVKAWLNDVILEMEKEGMVSGGFAKKLIA